MIGDAVVRPAGEVELPYLPDLVSSSLRSRVIVLNTHSVAAATRPRIQSVYGAKDPSKTNIELD